MNASKKIVECIPNFSEGIDQNIISQLGDAISSHSVKILQVDADKNYNRTVITFAGEPPAVSEAAFSAIQASARLIDMSRHKGQHPRIGATDVCPFIPVSTDMPTCIEMARALGRKVGSEVGIPVYLYGEAATDDSRRQVAVIRKGEYEGLGKKLTDPVWKPDFGPAAFNVRSGAVLIGARGPQLAYNVNIDTSDVTVVKKIAARVRESGEIVAGKRNPGTLKKTRAIGVILEEKGIAQVSMNLDDLNITNLYDAFIEVARQAENIGCRVTGSEICGVVSKNVLIHAGRKFAGPGEFLTDHELIELSVQCLGLSRLYPFDPGHRILEYALGIEEP